MTAKESTQDECQDQTVSAVVADGNAQSSIIPENDRERLAALRRYNILDTPADGAFDRITALVSELFDVPIAIASLVDHDRIWFKSHHGVDVDQIDRDPGLCASAILQDTPYILNDTRLDPVALSNPLVAGDFGLRFYAAVPLQTHDGYNLGTLCCLDFKPRELTDEQQKVLRHLGDVVMDEMELRLAARKVDELSQRLEVSNAELEKQKYMAEFELDLARQVFKNISSLGEQSIPGIDVWMNSFELVGGDFYQVHRTDGGRYINLMVGDLTGHGLQSALSVMVVTELFKDVCATQRPISEMVDYINEEMGKRLPKGLFCACAILTIDVESGDVSIWNGGLPDIYLLDEQGKVARALASKNLSLGVVASGGPKAVVETLKIGDFRSVLISSDGVTEQCDENGQAFGTERFIACIENKPEELTLVDHLTSQLAAYRAAAPQDDDITIASIDLQTLVSTRPVSH